MGFIMKLLSTVIAMALELLVTVKLPLPTPLENSISEPLLSVLNQVMVGRGEPSEVQVRVTGAGLSTCTMLAGSTMMTGTTMWKESNE